MTMSDLEDEYQEDTDMVNILTRIARDLERVLTGILICAGLLGLIATLILIRLLIGR